MVLSLYGRCSRSCLQLLSPRQGLILQESLQVASQDSAQASLLHGNRLPRGNFPKSKPQCTYQASVSMSLANAPLTKASHVVKPSIKERLIHICKNKGSWKL